MKRRGFSLMEMMIVLLIVAIVAAAAAPMISKKMLRDTDGGSPWLYTGLGGSITYNPDNNANKTAMIGTTSVPSNAGKARFYIESPSTEPQIALGTSGSSNVMNVTSKNYGIKISESKSGDVSDDSVGIGYKSEASGNYTTALGYIADASGSYAIALGTYANASASNSTALGTYAKAKHDYSTAIGYKAQTTASNQIVIGGPYNKSIVWNFKDMMQLGSSNSTIYIPGNLVVDRYAVLSRVSGEMLFRAQVGPPDEKSVYGNPEMSRIFMGDDKGGDDNTRTLRKYGWSYKVGNFTITSDRRLKNVGEAFSGGLDKIKQLKVYNYTFKDDEKKTPHVGVIAQDLQKVFPDAVTKGKDGFLRIRWEDMFYALVNAVKELDLRVTTENKELKKRIAELEKENKQLEERLSKLESKVFN